jgi:hypothetical protein
MGSGGHCRRQSSRERKALADGLTAAVIMSAAKIAPLAPIATVHWGVNCQSPLSMSIAYSVPFAS